MTCRLSTELLKSFRCLLQRQANEETFFFFLKKGRFNDYRVESSALQLVCPLDSRPVQLIFRGLQVVKEKRALLRDVSGVVKPGELLAVMGPSGMKVSTMYS